MHIFTKTSVYLQTSLQIAAILLTLSKAYLDLWVSVFSDSSILECNFIVNSIWKTLTFYEHYIDFSSLWAHKQLLK